MRSGCFGSGVYSEQSTHTESSFSADYFVALHYQSNNSTMDAPFSLRQTPPPISKAKLSCDEHEYTSRWVCDVMLLSARGFRWCHLVGQLRRGSIIDTATRVCSSTNHSDSQLSHHIIGAKITTLKRPVGRRVVPRFYVDFHVPTRWLSDLTSGKSFVTPCRSWSSPGRL